MAGPSIGTWVKVKNKSGRMTSRVIPNKFDGGGYSQGEVITQSEFKKVQEQRGGSKKGKNDSTGGQLGRLAQTIVQSPPPNTKDDWMGIGDPRSWFRDDGGVDGTKVRQAALDNSKYGQAFQSIEKALRKTGDYQRNSQHWQQVRYRFDEGLPLINSNDLASGRYRGTGITKSVVKKMADISDDYHPLYEQIYSRLRK